MIGIIVVEKVKKTTKVKNLEFHELTICNTLRKPIKRYQPLNITNNYDDICGAIY